MSQYDNTNSGALFKNNKMTSDKSPNMTGPLNIEGKEYRLAGWTKVSKAGDEYISLSVEPVEERKEESNVSNTGNGASVTPQPESEPNIDDEIPF